MSAKVVPPGRLNGNHVDTLVAQRGVGRRPEETPRLIEHHALAQSGLTWPCAGRSEVRVSAISRAVPDPRHRQRAGFECLGRVRWTGAMASASASPTTKSGAGRTDPHADPSQTRAHIATKLRNDLAPAPDFRPPTDPARVGPQLDPPVADPHSARQPLGLRQHALSSAFAAACTSRWPPGAYRPAKRDNRKRTHPHAVRQDSDNVNVGCVRGRSPLQVLHSGVAHARPEVRSDESWPEQGRSKPPTCRASSEEHCWALRTVNG